MLDSRVPVCVTDMFLLYSPKISVLLPIGKLSICQSLFPFVVNPMETIDYS